jgi:hypothetical protein
MRRAKVTHEAVLQGPIRDQVSLCWCDAFDDEVFESRICAQTDSQADSFAHALASKGSVWISPPGVRATSIRLAWGCNKHASTIYGPVALVPHMVL